MYIQLFFLNFGKKNNTNPFRIRFRKVSICGMITRKTLKLKPHMWQVESHPSMPSSSPCCHVKWRLVVYFWRPKSKLLYFFVYFFFFFFFLRPKNRRLYKFFFWDWKSEAFFLFFLPQRWKSRGQSLFFFGHQMSKTGVGIFIWKVKSEAGFCFFGGFLSHSQKWFKFSVKTVFLS